MKRRQFLGSSASLAGLLALPACGGGVSTSHDSTGGGSSTLPPPPSSPPTSPPPPVNGQVITVFRLHSPAAMARAPYAFGHPFRQGDVPSGRHVVGDGLEWQCSPLTYWPDGSTKHAVIAGLVDMQSGSGNVTLRVADSAPAGVQLTEADLAASLPSVLISAGGFSWTLGNSIGTGDLHRTVCAGPVMSNFIYRRAVAGSSHLVLWADVRLYKGGSVEIFPWVENAFFLVANPVNDVRTYAVVISGAQRFSQTIDVKHRTRVPLVSGSTFSYWTGTDPRITPQHDSTYLVSTKLVPNYGWRSPSTAALDGLQQAYTPNTLAGINAAMGTAGSSASLISNAQALYVTSGGDARAYRAAVVFGLSGGSWSTHYRDEVTNEPLKFSAYPDASFQGGSPAIPGGSGGTNGNAVTTHQSSYGYLPFLITGRWWFWEESAFWATWNYLNSPVDARRGVTAYQSGIYRNPSGSAGIIDPRTGAYANRGAHWSIRTLAQTLALCPSGHTTHADWKSAWEANADFYRAMFVDGTFGSGWVSPQGFMGDYSSSGNSVYGTPNGNSSWWGAAWMNNFGVQAWGFASDIGLAQSSQSQANHRAVRDHAYKQVTARVGDGTSYNWRRFAVYAYPIGADDVGLPPERWYTPAQSYTNYLSGFGLAAIPATAGLSLKQHSSDMDMTSGDSTAHAYGPFALSALAFAVDHSAADASGGWARISSASNWSVFNGLNDAPEHGIVPRGWTPNQ